MTDIKMLVEELVAYALDRNLIEAPDAVYSRNLLMDLLKLEEPAEGIEQGQPPVEAFEAARAKCTDLTPQPILDEILDYAVEAGILEDDTVTLRDLMDARIMGFFMARPSDLVHTFWKNYEESPEKASEYFYDQSRASHYIMTERVAKNLYWTAPTPYGD
ncbi:MAG: galactose-1-phosphate uridylyltransferase, partial [Firmicutes bacterium]|nr:galactose-1-phosphate uridylyltransferase [Bacillota bacterium]